MGSPADATGPTIAASEVELRLAVEPRGTGYVLTLSAHDPENGQSLAELTKENLRPDRFRGNLALVANYGPVQRRGRKRGGGDQAGVGTFWFADWQVAGGKVTAHDERAFGPILFSQYTLSGGTLKMTAQMPPLGSDDTQEVRLEDPTKRRLERDRPRDDPSRGAHRDVPHRRLERQRGRAPTAWHTASRPMTALPANTTGPAPSAAIRSTATCSPWPTFRATGTPRFPTRGASRA